MKKKIIEFYKEIIQSRPFFPFLIFFFKVTNRIYSYKNELKRDLDNRAIKSLDTLFNKKKVLDGPFIGLDYGETKSKGSQLYPKLLGTYEEELYPIINSIIKNNNTELVVDIGCAEGYYAVGFALKLKNAKIIAIDNNEDALRECENLALINNVQNRIELKNAVTTNISRELDSCENSLLLCDCEGCERDIFISENLSYFNRTSMIIEVHEFIVPGVGKHLVELFKNTHDIKIINQENRKVKTYLQLKKLKYYHKLFAVDEKRPTKMKWVYAMPKRNK